jgi:hypothetical protein
MAHVNTLLKWFLKISFAENDPPFKTRGHPSPEQGLQETGARKRKENHPE